MNGVGGNVGEECLRHELAEIIAGLRAVARVQLAVVVEAEQLEVDYLGAVPLVPALREGADDGRPIVAFDPDGEAAQAFGARALRQRA